jgi:hypothetical protein
VPLQRPFLSRNTNSGWIREFGCSGSESGNCHGDPKTLPAEENVEAVKESVQPSPRCSARVAQEYPEGVWTEVA